MSTDILQQALDINSTLTRLRSSLATATPAPFELSDLYAAKELLAQATPFTLAAIARATREAADLLMGHDPEEVTASPSWKSYEQARAENVPGTEYPLSTWLNTLRPLGIPVVNIDRAAVSGARGVMQPYGALVFTDPAWLTKSIDKVNARLKAEALKFAPSIVQTAQQYAQATLEHGRTATHLASLSKGVTAQNDALLLARVEALDLSAVPSTVQYDITRPWGVEIEFIFDLATTLEGRIKALTRLFERLGLPLGTDYTKWQIKSDDSVTHPDLLSTGPNPELVSPPLEGTSGQATYRRVLAAIANIGGMVNPSTGAHVSLHAPDFRRPEAQEALVATYHAQSATIEQFLPPTRLASPYRGRLFLSKHQPHTPLLQEFVAATDHVYKFQRDALAPSLQDENTIDVLSKAASIRFNKLATYEILEFRQLEGTLDPDRVLSWTETMSRLLDWSVKWPQERPILRIVNNLLTVNSPHRVR